MKTCTKCKETKSLELFYKASKNKDGYTTECKLCNNKRSKEWRENNPERKHRRDRNNNLVARYGITIEDYEDMFERQGRKCGICRTSENYSGHTGYRKDWSFSVDHCHDTGRIRGLLCNVCNRALGLFKDNKTVLTNALIWLDNKDV